MTKEFHRSWTVYVTSAQSHPCAIKQITFTSTYWLRYAAAVCPNMAKIQNIRPAVPTWYWSSLHELFSFHCLEWMHMNNYIKKAMFSLNTIGFFNFLRSNSQPHFGWHAGCTTNMMRASSSFHKPHHNTAAHIAVLAVCFKLYLFNIWPRFLTWLPLVGFDAN